MNFSFDELEIIKIFYTDSDTREKLISELKTILPHVEEIEMTEITQELISKLETLTDEEFQQEMGYQN